MLARTRLFEDGKPVSGQGHCLAIYSRAVNAEIAAERSAPHLVPVGVRLGTAVEGAVAGYVEAKQAQNVLDYDDLLLYWAQMVSDPSLADDIGNRFDHVLVDEYQDTNRLQSLSAAGPEARPAPADGRRRRRAVDLLVPGGDGPQPFWIFRKQFCRRPRSSRSTATDVRPSPILAAANGVIDLAGNASPRTSGRIRESAERPKLLTVRDEADQANCIVEQVLANRESGMLLKQQASSSAPRATAAPSKWN